ncbi:MAG: BMP family ABC transporter substrate-binding protein [Clostridiaceae bacterium]
MPDIDMERIYNDAYRLGIREYKKHVSKGDSGYLPSLEGLLRNAEIVSEVNIGIMEIPLSKIAGTYYHSRSISFAHNYMPILADKTEFCKKWEHVAEWHLTEGIKHSIKVYEYLNWFYVVEGNKRVSVLKFYGAYSISANVTRLIPKYDESDIGIKIYYEFLKFNKLTGINSIWFSKAGGFTELTKLLENYNPDFSPYDNKYKYFEKNIFSSFREVYLSLGGQKLPITTGDAFLEYAKIYGIEDEIDEKNLKTTLKEFIHELELIANKENVDIQTAPVDNSGNLLYTLTNLVMVPKRLKVAFVYARTIEGSGWTNSHEMGRRYIENVFRNQITTSYIEDVPENDDAYKSIKKLSAEGNDIIFTTSPIYLNATLKCSMEFPNIKYFNCSEFQPYLHVSTYYGRSYEVRFLMGIIAGALTRTNLIGYITTSPNPLVIASLNAFSLGAKLVNPYAKIVVEWTNEWNSRDRIHGASERLKKRGVDIIANKNLKQPSEISKKYGVFSMLSRVDESLTDEERCIAAPIWNWGLFYEKILKNIQSESFKDLSDIFSTNSKLINFYWGMASGVIDIFYLKENIPAETEKLLTLIKKMIIDNDYNPFTGPIYDNNGTLRVEEEEALSHEDILSMDWFTDNIELT